MLQGHTSQPKFTQITKNSTTHRSRNSNSIIFQIYKNPSHQLINSTTNKKAYSNAQIELPEFTLFTLELDWAAEPSLPESFFDTSLTPLPLLFTSSFDDPQQEKHPIFQLTPKKKEEKKKRNPPKFSILSLYISIYANFDHQRWIPIHSKQPISSKFDSWKNSVENFGHKQLITPPIFPRVEISKERVLRRKQINKSRKILIVQEKGKERDGKKLKKRKKEKKKICN